MNEVVLSRKVGNVSGLYKALFSPFFLESFFDGGRSFAGADGVVGQSRDDGGFSKLIRGLDEE
jgi:hypothetical protein